MVKKLSMSLKVCIILISLLLTFQIGSELAYSHSSYTLVESTSRTLFVGGTGANNYTSIQQAIDESREGDVIMVSSFSSPYQESIQIDKSIHLIGENEKNTIIQGGYEESVVRIIGRNATFSQFTVKQGLNSCILINSNGNKISNVILSQAKYGIDLEFCSDNHITNADISDTSSGFYLFDSFNNHILQNTIAENTIGITLKQNSKYNKIGINSISHNEQGIFFINSMFNELYLNQVTFNEKGIHFTNTNDNIIYNKNQINNNEIGIFFENCLFEEMHSENKIESNQIGLYVFRSNDLLLSENILKNNYQGLLINHSSQLNVYWNQFCRNSHGIQLDSSDNIYIYLNNITNNMGIGLFLENTKHSKIIYNNFINNNADAYYDQDLWSRNLWLNNYWSTWDQRGAYVVNGTLHGPSVFSFIRVYDFRPASTPYNI